MTARFAPADIGADLRALPENERQALAKLVEAARLMDSLFLRQVWAGNDAHAPGSAHGRRHERVRRGDAGRRRHAAALLPDQQGPVVAARSQRAFVPGAPAKPEAANFYPAGATKDEVQNWIDSLTGDAKARATGFFTTIRRGPDGRLHRRAVQRRVSGRAGARRGAAARSGAS